MSKKLPFAEEEASDSSGFLLWQVTAMWQRKVARALRPHGLTQVQYALLASLLWLENREDHITQAFLAAHAKLDAMMTSQVLRALEARKLVERKPHPTDTRAKVVRLTGTGRNTAKRAVPDVEGTDAAFFGVLGAKQEALNRRLRTLIDAG